MNSQRSKKSLSDSRPLLLRANMHHEYDVPGCSRAEAESVQVLVLPFDDKDGLASRCYSFCRCYKTSGGDIHLVDFFCEDEWQQEQVWCLHKHSLNNHVQNKKMGDWEDD